MRIALMVEYDGSHYHGWQAQTGLHTVQSALEKALTAVANHPVSVVCAGRTDTGVHATSQVVHFESDTSRSIRAWIHGTNSFLPKDMSVYWGREMPDNFHARYSALFRRYCYVIYNAPIRPGLLRSNVTWQYQPLDNQLMQEASQYLLGEQDFTSFRSVECQSKTPMRFVKEIQVKRYHDYIVIDITANAFLHHMVRNIAGVLITVGSSRKTVSWVNDVLLAKDRRMGAQTAPPYGLYLVSVTYPEEFNMLQRVGYPMFLSGGNQ